MNKLCKGLFGVDMEWTPGDTRGLIAGLMICGIGAVLMALIMAMSQAPK